MKLRAIAAISVLTVSALAQSTDSQTTAQTTTPNPPMLGAHWARGMRPPNPAIATAATNPKLIYHSGRIMTSSVVKVIYWGTKWSSSTFVKDKITGLASWYTGASGTRYMGTNTEYTGSNGRVGTSVSYKGYVKDTTAAPKGAPSTSTIQAEVCKRITAPVTNGYYPVYVDTPRGTAKYCAWHSYGTCSGVVVQFGFFFNLDGDAACDPQDTWTSHSQGLSALANVTGHELSEAVTDPRGYGWWDSAGAENADKCAWTFNHPVNFGTTAWKVQGNWSNAAYNSNQSGYTKGGCIDGN